MTSSRVVRAAGTLGTEDPSMLNWLMRYQPVIQVLDERAATDVLDVGSGWYGLSWYWPRLVVQTDLRFSPPRPSGDERLGSAVFVCASADALPLADSSCDFAVSLDMVEHLPDHLRAPAIAELCRVSRRGFVVGYPVGSNAAWTDRQLHRLFRWTPGCRVPDWLEEHTAQQSYPTEQTLQEALPLGWEIVERRPSGNVAAHVLICYLEHLPGFRALAQGLEARLRHRGFPRLLDVGPSYRTIFVILPSGTR